MLVIKVVRVHKNKKPADIIYHYDPRGNGKWIRRASLKKRSENRGKR